MCQNLFFEVRVLKGISGYDNCHRFLLDILCISGWGGQQSRYIAQSCWLKRDDQRAIIRMTCRIFNRQNGNKMLGKPRSPTVHGAKQNAVMLNLRTMAFGSFEVDDAFHTAPAEATVLCTVYQAQFVCLFDCGNESILSQFTAKRKCQ